MNLIKIFIFINIKIYIYTTFHFFKIIFCQHIKIRLGIITAQNMKFSIKDSFGKCDPIDTKFRILCRMYTDLNACKLPNNKISASKWIPELVFFFNITKSLRTTFFIEHLECLLLQITHQRQIEALSTITNKWALMSLNHTQIYSSWCIRYLNIFSFLDIHLWDWATY